jgi:hypothetical protein
LITLAAGAVAMARHPSVWLQAASRTELPIVLGCLAAIAVGLLVRVRSSLEPRAGNSSHPWTGATAISLISVFVLAVYPEQLIQETATHLLTVLVGALLLFAPLRAVLTALEPDDPRQDAAKAAAWPRCVYGWGRGTLAGIGIDASLFGADMLEEGGPLPSLGQLVFVGLDYLGLATAGLLISSAFVRGPLGL